MNNYLSQTKKKAIFSMIAIFVLFCMLALTTYALITSFVSVEDNLLLPAE